MTNLAVSFEDVITAQGRIKGIAHHTPVMTSRTADNLAGTSLFFKCENFQRVGAFKFRGAYNALSQFTNTQKEKGVIAYSSGNHAQAIALAASILKMRAVIVMPEDAPSIKVTATRGYGAEVILYDRYTQDREAIGKKLAEEQGLTLIPPYVTSLPDKERLQKNCLRKLKTSIFFSSHWAVADCYPVPRLSLKRLIRNAL